MKKLIAHFPALIFLASVIGCGGEGFGDANNSGGFGSGGGGLNKPPIAEAGPDAFYTGATYVVMYGQGTDLDGIITGYTWDQIEGTDIGFNLDDGGKKIIIELPNVSEVYVYQLTVTDDDGATGSDEMSITMTALENPPPFTKVVELKSGSTLSNDWSCAIDQRTGLMWEVKTNTPGPRYSLAQFQWGSNDNSVAICNSQFCSTAEYIHSINQQKLCGKDNWRLPSKAELLALQADKDGKFAQLDRNIFSASQPGQYLTSDTDDEMVWAIESVEGRLVKVAKSQYNQVRLVSDPETN